MFVADKVLVRVGFDDAKARLGSLARGDGLASASEAAYSGGVTGLVWPGTPESAPAGLRLAKVRSHDLVDSEDCAGLALRWEAIAPDGGLFPALDADIKLTKTGEQATLVTVTGTYRTAADFVAAGLDRMLLYPVAAATIRILAHRVADAISVLPLAWPDQEGRP